ncbi:FAD-binding protein [Chloroflexus sp.]|uniref:FAD-binding protein n=1 Tax=Chloroflexus sp. TaxID=1904827 RepID=UPI00298EDBBF|nr:FAD-binding protein [Chloroflexus sp.]MDW8403835.1 FAD-binding protein [Chloroflexus sp.]
MTVYDMIVVGSGFAGSAATLSFLETAAREQRSGRVALIEVGKKGERAGASRWTMAYLRLTRDNRLSSEWIKRVEQDCRGKADLEYCRVFASEVPNTVKFFEDHGVELIHHDEPNVALEFDEQHFVYPKGGGKAIIDAYFSHIERYDNVDIFWEHEAIKLTLDDEGRVNGIVVRKPDGLLKTLKGRAVVLACGGFEGNYEMLTQYIGERAVDLPLIAPGIRYNRGAGIRMAMEIGAGTSGQFDMIHAELVDTRATKPDAVIWGHNYGIVVNEHCQRFYDEGEDYLFASFELIAYYTWRDQNQKAYFITDKTVMDRFRGSWVYETTDQPPEEADTIRGLAEKLGLDPNKLEATVMEFNAACGPGEWDPARLDGKRTYGIEPPKSNWANPIATPPFYGFPMTTNLTFTFGGLKVDTEGRVLSTNDVPIPGLYAAGEITGLFYHEYPPATSVLRCNTFGRLIGARIARSLEHTA